MNEEHDHIEIEFAIWILNHPQSRKETAVVEWLKEPGHKRLLEELRCVREGSLRALRDREPDREAVWRDLNRRITRRRITWRYRVAVGCLLVVVSASWLWNASPHREMEPFAMSEPKDNRLFKGVTLVLNDQDTIDLEGDYGMKTGEGSPEVSSFMSIDPSGGLIYSYKSPEKESVDWHTLCVPRGGEYFVVLDDGTKVWLNAETELHYPVVFSEDERVVDLTGEAYFQVKPDEKRPFIVRTKNLQTRVLGTEFNVRAYRLERENVTLVNGEVGVRSMEKENEVILKPNENVLYSENKLLVSKVDVQKYVSWKEGYFYYDNERLEDILDELGRWYDFNIFYSNPEMKEMRFKFWAERKENFSGILERLREMGRLKFKCTDNNVVVF